VDETFGERVSVTVIATGFDQRLATRRREEQEVAEPQEEPIQQEGDVLDIPAFLRRR
jgi:cell division protein FtsZ